MTDKGDLVRFSTNVSISGSFVDPQYVLLKVRPPDGVFEYYFYTPTGSSLIREFSGRYYKDIFMDQSGQWRWYWNVSGSAFGASEGYFLVDTSAF